MSQVHEVTDATFVTEVLESQIPVLVDFWAPWCAPCKALSPTIDALATEYTGRVKFAKINTDENEGIPDNYGIRGLPCILILKDGEPVDQPMPTKPKIIEALNNVLQESNK